MLSEEYRYKILKRLGSQPETSQRELARDLGISLGKVNFCLNALIEKGLIKVNNFQANPNKRGYIYLLTPKGIEEKTLITMLFLKSKVREYESLSHEIEDLRSEVERLRLSDNY